MTQKRADDERELQLKVTLLGTRPPVWRRLVVREGMGLQDLHFALQITMGWFDEHLYSFTVKGTTYSVHDPNWPSDDVDVSTVSLRDLRLRRRGSKLDYTYDFGDNWGHRIEVEAAGPLVAEADYPRCLEGRRACPPEDCGGVYAFQHLLAAIADPRHPAHEESLEWVGEGYDPSRFESEEVNRELQRAFRTVQ